MASLFRSPSRSRSSMVRLTITGLFCQFCCGLAAQKSAEIDYSIHFEPAFSGSSIKFVREALLASDPGCLIWPDAPTQRVVVRTTVPVNAVALQQDIPASGLHVVSVELLLPSDPQERKAMIMASMGFPTYLDTGHPEQDQNNYLTAKAAWIDADPARYEELMRALNPGQFEAR